jgi:hypothetical protein
MYVIAPALHLQGDLCSLPRTFCSRLRWICRRYGTGYLCLANVRCLIGRKWADAHFAASAVPGCHLLPYALLGLHAAVAGDAELALERWYAVYREG